MILSEALRISLKDQNRRMLVGRKEKRVELPLRPAGADTVIGVSSCRVYCTPLTIVVTS